MEHHCSIRPPRSSTVCHFLQDQGALPCNDCTDVIDRYIRFDGYRHTGVIVRATQVIPIQSIGQIGKGDMSIGEQSRNIEDFHLLILGGILRFFDFLLVVELGVDNLVDNVRDCLHFAHALTNGNPLLVQREITVRTVFTDSRKPSFFI